MDVKLLSSICIGKITNDVISVLQLSNIAANTPVYLGDSNIEHMKSKHLEAYNKYGNNIEMILLQPDYVGINPKDKSIEYVKEFKCAGEYVKVAVRVSGSNKYFARSIYILNNNRVKNFVLKNSLKQLTNRK